MLRLPMRAEREDEGLHVELAAAKVEAVDHFRRNAHILVGTKRQLLRLP
jgi:hypothetical protein